MTVALLIALGAYLLGAVLSPFVYWPGYFRLWGRVFVERSPGIPRSSRWMQMKRLCRFALIAPWYTLLWYLDELLYPAARRIKITAPVFIVAQPRTGTTLLHRILAEDGDTFASPRHIEMRYPFVSVQRLLRATGLMTLVKGWDNHPSTEAGKRMTNLHSNTLDDWEELGNLFLECSLFHFFAFFRFPYRQTLEQGTSIGTLPAPVRRRLLRVLHRFIQKTLYLQGPDKVFLAKEKESIELLQELDVAYPDARFITTVRHPSEWMTSFLQLSAAATAARAGADSTRIEGFEDWLLARKIRDCRFQVDREARVPSERRVVIAYHELSRDTHAVIERVYRHLNLAPGLERRAALRALQERQWRRVARSYPLRSFPELQFYAEHYQVQVWTPERDVQVIDDATDALERRTFDDFVLRESARLGAYGVGTHVVRVVVDERSASAKAENPDSPHAGLGADDAERLRRYAECLRASCRPGDLIGRVGRQQLAVAFFATAPADEGDVVARVRVALAEAGAPVDEREPVDVVYMAPS